MSILDRVIAGLSAMAASLDRADQAATVSADVAWGTADPAAQLGAARLADRLAMLVGSCRRLSTLVLTAADSAHQTTALGDH